MRFNKVISTVLALCTLCAVPPTNTFEMLRSAKDLFLTWRRTQQEAQRKKLYETISYALDKNHLPKLLAAVKALGESTHALEWAIERGKYGAVRALVMHGADPNAGWTNAGWTPPLCLATHLKQHLCMKVLLAQGAIPNVAVLKRAAANNDATAFEILLDHPDTNLDEQDNNRNTVLHQAIAQRNESLAHLLIGRGANTTIANNDGRVVQEFIDAREAGEECCICYETQDALDTTDRDNQLRLLPGKNVTEYICEKDLARLRKDGANCPITRQPFPNNFKVDNACKSAPSTLIVQL